MNRRIAIGSAILAFAYGALLALIPPNWAPWSTPLEFFAFIYVPIGLAVVSVVGAGMIGSEYARSQATVSEVYGVTVGATLAAWVPTYLYLIYLGYGAFAPVTIGMFAIAVVGGVVTGGLTRSSS